MKKTIISLLIIVPAFLFGQVTNRSFAEVGGREKQECTSREQSFNLWIEEIENDTLWPLYEVKAKEILVKEGKKPVTQEELLKKLRWVRDNPKKEAEYGLSTRELSDTTWLSLNTANRDVSGVASFGSKTVTRNPYKNEWGRFLIGNLFSTSYCGNVDELKSADGFIKAPPLFDDVSYDPDTGFDDLTKDDSRDHSRKLETNLGDSSTRVDYVHSGTVDHLHYGSAGSGGPTTLNNPEVIKDLGGDIEDYKQLTIIGASEGKLNKRTLKALNTLNDNQTEMFGIENGLDYRYDDKTGRIKARQSGIGVGGYGLGPVATWQYGGNNYSCGGHVGQHFGSDYKHWQWHEYIEPYWKGGDSYRYNSGHGHGSYTLHNH